MINIDKILGGVDRRFSRYEGTIALGSTGDRLWTDYLFIEPGFRGKLGYIHTAEIRKLFCIKVVSETEEQQIMDWKHTWYPSHSELYYLYNGVKLTEKKFITRDDCAVSILTILNKRSDEVVLKIDNAGTKLNGQHIHGVTVHTLIRSEPDSSVIRAAPNTEKTIRIISCLTESKEEGKKRLESRLGDPRLFESHRGEYQKWFDFVPRFKCSDPYMEKMWYYRWFLIRYNMAVPAAGFLPNRCFYDGRHGIVTEDTPAGEEKCVYGFSAWSTCNATHSLAELKWYRNPALFRESLSNFFVTQDDDVTDEYYTKSGKKAVYSPPGMFVSVIRSDSLSGTYHPHFIQKLTAEFLNVWPDTEWAERILAYLCRDVETYIQYFAGDDLLPVCDTHGNTAMEYQPSFFFFNKYPRMKRGYGESLNHETPLKRTDFAAYLQANISGIIEIARRLGKTGIDSKYTELKERVDSTIAAKMWDANDSIFYDLHYMNNEKARTKGVTGFWPFFLAEDKKAENFISMFRLLEDPESFGTLYPAPSASRDCPVYAPDNTWHGERVHMCLWNGPAWPYSTSLLGRCLSFAARIDRHFIPVFVNYMKQYTTLMYRDGNIDEPCVVEHYNPETGTPLSTEDDYFHSHYIDLIVQNVAGLRPGAGDPSVLSPFDFGIGPFSFTGIPWKNGLIDIDFDGDRLRVSSGESSAERKGIGELRIPG